MADIGDIRRAASGAARELKQFNTAARALRKRVVRAVQTEGRRKVFKNLHTRYEQERYADSRGLVKRIGAYGSKWRRRKIRLGLDLRRGVARKGIIKAVRSPRAFVKTPKGFVIDIEAADITVTGRSSVARLTGRKGGPVFLAGKRVITGKGKDRQVSAILLKQTPKSNRRSFRVNNYIRHFAKRKAPGLGNMTSQERAFLLRVARDTALQHLQGIKGAASRRLGQKAFAKLVIRLDRVASPATLGLGRAI